MKKTNDEMAGVSGILQRRDVMGSTAVDILNSLLQRNHRGTNETSQGSQIDRSWFEGKTLRPAAVMGRISELSVASGSTGAWPPSAGVCLTIDE